MFKTIVNGFPLRRCSWVFNPIVTDVLNGKMVRWLDFVCQQQPSVKLKSLLNRRCDRETTSCQ